MARQANLWTQSGPGHDDGNESDSRWSVVPGCDESPVLMYAELSLGSAPLSPMRLIHFQSWPQERKVPGISA